MISGIDRFVNRALFSINDMGAALCYLISLLVYWLLWRSFCSIPFIKRWLKKSFKDDDYRSIVEKFDDWSPYNSSKSFYRMYSHDYRVSILFFFLPISLLLNVVIIIVGKPMILLYSNSIGIVFLIVVTVLLSGWLSDYFFWKNDRHHAFVKTFMKEKLIRRIAWVVGTLVALVLLSVVNIRLFVYIVDMQK